MADYHQIVDQIRAFIQSSDQTRTSLLESLASSYAEACVDVNQRMGRCHRLLQRGLRSEAIQLAESEPKLLDSLGALDFPERADWDELLQIYQLTPAPKLALDHAQFLNEAYAEEDPLQDFLRVHRRLALQRAPIKSRIAVMRQLAAQDTTNPIWNDDLRVFEKARFRQVEAEATMAAQSQNVATIGQLLAEIEQQTWVEPPPKALVQGLRKMDARFRGQQNRALLNDLDARLNDAFSARDPIRGRLTRKQWIALTAAAPLAPSDPIWDRVRPSLSWLEEEDRRDELDHAHEAAMGALLSALDDSGHVPSAELERLAKAVLQYGRGMPEGIQQRYVSRLRFAETAQERRWRVIIAGAAAGVFLAGSLTFYLIRSWTQASDAAQAAGALSEIVERGEIEQATGFLQKLQKENPGLLSYSSMIEARQKFQAMQGKEDDRVRQFGEAFNTAERAPVEQLDPAGLEGARKLARRHTEKQAVEKLVQQRAAALASKRAESEKKVGPHLDAVGRKIAHVKEKVESARSGLRDDSEILGPLAEARHELAVLGPDLPFVGDELQGLVTALGQKIDAINARFDLVRRQARIEEELTDAAAYSAAVGPGKLIKFATGLDAYIKSFPDDPRTVVFQRTRDEQSLWNDIDAWNALTPRWKGRHAELNPELAKKLAELCGRFVTQHPSFPGTADVVRYQRYAEAIARRTTLDGGPVVKLRRLFSDTFVNHIWMITVEDVGDDNVRTFVKYYYATQPPEEKLEFVQFHSIISFEGKELSRTIHKNRVTHLGLSPQSKIASRFNPVLRDDSKLGQWETVMIDLIEAIRRQPDIEPVLQVALLRKVVALAVEGSEPLRESLKATKNQLDQSTVDVNVAWMNPDAPGLVANRADAAQVVNSLPDLALVRKEAVAQRDQIERGVTHSYHTVGWLVRNPDGWQLRHGGVVPNQGELWVVAPMENKHGDWKKVGAITGGKPKIDAIDGSSLAEGRPVFVITDRL